MMDPWRVTNLVSLGTLQAFGLGYQGMNGLCLVSSSLLNQAHKPCNCVYGFEDAYARPEFA